MKPFPPRLGHSRARQPSPLLSSSPEEGAGETQPFSLQSASSPRRCWCRSGCPHPSLPPFWKHTVRRLATAPAQQCTGSSPPAPAPPPASAPPLHPTPDWRAGGCGRGVWPRPLKALVEVFPPPASAAEEAVARRLGRGRAGPGGRERAGRKRSEGLALVALPRGGPAALPQLGRRLFPPPGPRPAAPAPPRLPGHPAARVPAGVLLLPPGEGAGGRPPSFTAETRVRSGPFADRDRLPSQARDAASLEA